jgi:hypothetical protein
MHWPSGSHPLKLIPLGHLNVQKVFWFIGMQNATLNLDQ